ncbi:MAG: response regulator [Nitrospinae bacterium]|nr:response regulator [Nitrospinota bacterium]
MRKIRILVVDDAVVVRKIVTNTLSSDPDIEVAATAANGKIALQKIPQIKPDILTLDIEIPEIAFQYARTGIHHENCRGEVR